MGSLVTAVAHEVRNPLFGLSATVDAFEARFGDREEFARYFKPLREQVDRVSQLMRELLEYGSPMAADLKYLPRPKGGHWAYTLTILKTWWWQIALKASCLFHLEGKSPYSAMKWMASHLVLPTI